MIFKYRGPAADKLLYLALTKAKVSVENKVSTFLHGVKELHKSLDSPKQTWKLTSISAANSSEGTLLAMAVNPISKTGDAVVAVTEQDEDSSIYERRLVGLKLPSYFSKHPERKLVRRLDLFIL